MQADFVKKVIDNVQHLATLVRDSTNGAYRSWKNIYLCLYFLQIPKAAKKIFRDWFESSTGIKVQKHFASKTTNKTTEEDYFELPDCEMSLSLFKNYLNYFRTPRWNNNLKYCILQLARTARKWKTIDKEMLDNILYERIYNQ
ncbi:unnamed protein product [Ambrosiozyma monospora]|uniref:Unnamed protein product n=1 Tax=Ambrosiozyma monospora TaxID=43982 RepID=A0A9W6YS71_AMBMO|nr:unnamed protein product [Ambrosiozyma monospora]